MNVKAIEGIIGVCLSEKQSTRKPRYDVSGLFSVRVRQGVESRLHGASSTPNVLQQIGVKYILQSHDNAETEDNVSLEDMLAANQP